MKRSICAVFVVLFMLIMSSTIEAERHHVWTNYDVDFYLLTESVDVAGNWVDVTILRDWAHGQQEAYVRVRFSPWGTTDLHYRLLQSMDIEWLPVKTNHWSGNAVEWLKNNGY